MIQLSSSICVDGLVHFCEQLFPRAYVPFSSPLTAYDNDFLCSRSLECR